MAKMDESGKLPRNDVCADSKILRPCTSDNHASVQRACCHQRVEVFRNPSCEGRVPRHYAEFDVLGARSLGEICGGDECRAPIDDDALRVKTCPFAGLLSQTANVEIEARWI